MVKVKQLVPAIDSTAPDGVRNGGEVYELEDEDAALRLAEDGAIELVDVKPAQLARMRKAMEEHAAARASNPDGLGQAREEPADAPPATGDGQTATPTTEAAAAGDTTASGDGDGADTTTNVGGTD